MWVRLYKCKHVRKHRGECSPSSWWEDSEDALLVLVSRWSVNLIRSMVKRDVALFVRGAQVFLSDWKRFTREHFLTSHPCRCFRPLHGLNHLEQVCNWTLGWCCFANCLLPRWRMKPNTWWHWHKPSCMNENKKVRGERRPWAGWDHHGDGGARGTEVERWMNIRNTTEIRNSEAFTQWTKFVKEDNVALWWLWGHMSPVRCRWTFFSPWDAMELIRYVSWV